MKHLEFCSGSYLISLLLSYDAVKSRPIIRYIFFCQFTIYWDEDTIPPIPLSHILCGWTYESCCAPVDSVE